MKPHPLESKPWHLPKSKPAKAVKARREYAAGCAVYGELNDATLWLRIPYSEQLPYIRAALAAIKAAGLEIR